jgi:hypothetical protein
VTETSPPARRLSRPRWLDTRVALGVLLVLTAVVVGARVLASAGRYSEVYLARRPLVPGQHLAAGDLTTGRVRFDGEAARYVAAGRVPVGYLVTRYVAAGEFVPLAAVTGSSSRLTATRLVSLPVSGGHLPADLGRGDEVDVYLTTKSGAGGPVAPQLVISAAIVDSVDGSGSLSGDDSSAVGLVVPTPQVAAVVAAVESGSIDLVRVPDDLVAASP